MIFLTSCETSKDTFGKYIFSHFYRGFEHLAYPEINYNDNNNIIPRSEREQREFTARWIKEKSVWRESRRPLIYSYSQVVFNELRLAVKNGILDHQQVAIHFLNSDDEIEIFQMDKSGRLSAWPKGFFDTVDFQLYELL